MTDIAMIACCKSKKETAVPVPAGDLYTGTLFRAQLAYARQVLRLDDDNIFVLSAKYGLLNIATAITPYEMTLAGQSREARDEWGHQVVKSLVPQFGLQLDKVWFLTGQSYRNPVRPYLLADYPNITIATPHPPGFGIGQQVKWYQAAVKKAG